MSRRENKGDRQKHTDKKWSDSVGLPQVEKYIVDIATQKGHDTDADGKHGAEAEAVAVLMEHGERHLAVASSVALAAVACVAGRRVSHTGAVAAWAASTQCVDTHFAQRALLGQVAWRAPVQRSQDKAKTRDAWEAVR